MCPVAVVPDRIHVPVSIESTDLPDFFTASSMRVCRSFFRSMDAALTEVGDAFTQSSMRMAREFFRAQINEADAHGIGTCPWVVQMSGCLERMELRLEQGISPAV